MHALAKILFQKVAFEINMTSNEYLLGQSIRGCNYRQIRGLNEFFKIKTPIMLSTDDDGIFPIERCSINHPGHHSLTSEYCRAISSSLFKTDKQLHETFETMKTFFFQDMNHQRQGEFTAEATAIECPPMNNLIVHPHIISLILAAYGDKEKNSAIEEYNIDTANNGISRFELDWDNEYALLRVAFVCICALRNPSNKNVLRDDYQKVFGISETSSNEFNFIFDNWLKIANQCINRVVNRCPTIMIENQEKIILFL